MNKLTLKRLGIELICLSIVVLAIYFTSRALFHEGFFRTIDDITTVRLNHMARELARGELANYPVRLGAELSHQFGYFVYLFYSPLVYYAGAVAMLLAGISDIVATKLVYVFPLIIGPFLFYFAARLKLTPLSALGSTLLYTFFPFRGFDTYIRGGVGEAWAMAFLPGVFAALFLYERKSRSAGGLLTLFLSLIILSHNLSALLILGFLMLYLLFLTPKASRLWISILHSLLLTSFFYVPSLVYSSQVQVLDTLGHNGLLTNYLLPLQDLLTPRYAYSTHDKHSPWLAYILIIGLITSLFPTRRASRLRRPLLVSSLLGLLFYFAMSQESLWIWNSFYSQLRTLQFPWRLLIVLSTVIPLVFGYLIELSRSALTKLGLLGFSLALCFIYLPVFKPLSYHSYYNYNAEDTGPCATSWGEEYLPKWVKKCISAKPSFIAKLPDDSTPTNIQGNLINTSFTFTTRSGGYIEANRYYFPGWSITVDGQPSELEYTYGINGLFRTKINPGDHAITIAWQKTPLMRIVDSLSLLALLTLIGETVYVAVYRKKT